MLSESTFPASEKWAFPFFRNAGLMYHHLQVFNSHIYLKACIASESSAEHPK
jgi:hypothetical protein